MYYYNKPNLSNEQWVIHKHLLTSFSENICLPRQTKILSAQWQTDQIAIWYVRPVSDRDMINIYVSSINTGEIIYPWQLSNFLGTVQAGSIAWHIFYRKDDL